MLTINQSRSLQASITHFLLGLSATTGYDLLALIDYWLTGLQ